MGNREASAAYPLRAVDRVCDVLDVLQQSPNGASLTLVAERTGLPKSSAVRYLSALEARKYVERESAGGGYRLGLAFRSDRTQYLDAVRTVAAPHLARLRDRFEETINLAILDGAEMVYVEVAESPRSVRLSVRRDDRAGLHSTAIGKAVATLLPERRIREILAESGMPALTPDTITDPDAYLAEVALTAERGYALDDCEDAADGRCVAVVIPDLPVPAALSLSAPASRFAAEDASRVAGHLRKAAANLGIPLRKLTY